MKTMTKQTPDGKPIISGTSRYLGTVKEIPEGFISKADLLAEIERMQSEYDNYLTMMSSKSNYQKGDVARKICSDLASWIKEN